MINVTVYIRENCPDCDQVLADLESLQAIVPHQTVTVDVTRDQGLRERIGELLPVVEIGPYRLQTPIARQDLQVVLSAARDRAQQMEQVDQETYQQRVNRGRVITSSDRLSIFFSRHYLALINVLLLVYVSLPFLAPVMMKTGNPIVASMIYKGYSPMCHQLAFRSWFLFGAQPYYPRELAGLAGLTPYETIIDSQEIDLLQARNFVGNETLGYKVALCERDVAIYGTMLLFGVVYSLTGRRFRSIPWYMWIAIGLVPIGLDGVSQLPSFSSGLPSWIIRESTPLLRTITGALFGLMTAWYLFPMIEESARETRRVMQRKLAVIQQANRANQT